MVDEEEEEWVVSEASSRRSYSNVVRDGSPSPVRAESPEIPRVGGSSSSRPQPVRRMASGMLRPETARAAGGEDLCGRGGGRRGPQPKRQRYRGPLLSLVVPPGVPAGFACLCYNCAEPGHVAGMCTGPHHCLICKSEYHVACKCPDAVVPVAGEVAVGAPPPPCGGPPPPAAPAAALGPAAGAQGTPGELYRVPARQRLGPREGSPPPPSRPALQGRLDDRGAAPVAVESPFERGLRLEREIRAAPPLLPEERAQGISFLNRERRRELELRVAALRAVAGATATEQGLAPEVPVDVEAARPACERGIIYRTPEVESAERALR
ncbi:hypothetical protein ACQ4PT_004552 [Festuca glaucescens]